MVCKDRHDSFVGETDSILWADNSRLDDSFHPHDIDFIEPVSKQWPRNLNQRASRPTPVITPSTPVITPSRSRKKRNNLCSEDSYYGDENRPTNANVVDQTASGDRKQAMKIATRPLIGIAESPTTPRLSDMASAQFKRGNSMQRICSNSMQLSPRSVVTSPACKNSQRQRQMSPHHMDGNQTPGRQTPGLVGRPPSFSLGSPVAGHSSPRGGKAPPLRVFAHSPSHSSLHQADWPALEPFVVYEPRGGSASHASPRGGSDSYVLPSPRGGSDSSYAPAALQADRKSVV